MQYPKPKTFRSKPYRIWLRTQPCEGCGSSVGVSAHHESALSSCNGIGIKVSDKYCLPLCAECHRLRHDTGPITFWGKERLAGLPVQCKRYVNEFLSAGNHFEEQASPPIKGQV